MTCLDLLLGPELPEVDLTRTEKDVVGELVKMNRSQDILRPIVHLVNDGLDALVRSNVPDLDDLVSAE